MARTNDYGTATSSTGRLLRPLILANHALHWISAIIVMSISAYFIHKFTHNAHLIYWVTIASIDAFFYLPALFLPAVKSYKGYLAPFAWAFSYLWLTAFIFSAQDYNNGRCVANSPAGVNKCALKQTIQAFAFLAFFTNLVGHLLEWRLWDSQRVAGRNAFDEKHATAPAAPATTEPTTAV